LADANGTSDARNDIMLHAIVNADSLDAAAMTFRNHPHPAIPQSSIEVIKLRPQAM